MSLHDLECLLSSFTSPNHSSFTAVVSNPPYQVDTGNGSRAVYHHLFAVSTMLAEKVSMVYPARWVTTGHGDGFKDFRERELSSTHYSTFIVYPGAKDVFRAEIAGGVNIFLWTQREHATIRYVHEGKVSYRSTLMNGFPYFLISGEYESIMSKVATTHSMKRLVHPEGYYGPHLRSDDDLNALSHTPDGVRIYNYFSSSRECETRMIPASVVSKDYSTHKVFISRAATKRTKEKFAKPGRIFLGEPGEICSNSYLQVGEWDTREEAVNALRYLKTDFAYFLLTVLVMTQATTPSSYVLIPEVDFMTGEIVDRPGEFLDFSRPATLDEQLYRIYGINEEEQKLISSKLRPWKDKVDVKADK